jgi:hypothetical protein
MAHHASLVGLAIAPLSVLIAEKASLLAAIFGEKASTRPVRETSRAKPVPQTR